MSGSATTLSLATLMHVRTTQAQPMQEYSRGNSWCQPVDENCPLFCLDNEQVSSGPDVRSTRPVAKRDNMEDAFLFRTATRSSTDLTVRSSAEAALQDVLDG